MAPLIHKSKITKDDIKTLIRTGSLMFNDKDCKVILKFDEFGTGRDKTETCRCVEGLLCHKHGDEALNEIFNIKPKRRRRTWK